MENLKHILSIVLLGLAAQISLANDTQVKVITSQDPEVFKLIFAAPAEQDVNIKLLNSRGTIVLKNEISNSKGFMLPLSFKGLPTGRYLLEVSAKDTKWTEEIQYVNMVDRLKDLLEVEFDSESKKCTVTSNNEFSGDWHIVVYNEDHDELISDEILGSSFNSRIYDLNGAPGRQREVVIMFKNEVISQWNF